MALCGGGNGLPVITSEISLSGHDTTIAGNSSDFRIIEVDGPNGNLTLDGLTITGGASNAFGGPPAAREAAAESPTVWRESSIPAL